MVEADWQKAVAKVNLLQRELDITNADHIALWIEANTIPDEPMSQCISWLAVQIVEAHERALSLMQPEIDRRVAEEKARLLEALRASAPIARTDVVKPVNGKPPYSVVMFKGFRIPFGEIHDIDEAPSADYGSGQAAAFADAINQALLTAFQQENSDDR